LEAIQEFEVMANVHDLGRYFFSDVFFGNSQPGTLLMDAPTFDIKPRVAPATDGSTMFQCDIQIPLKYFNPKKGVPTSSIFGWNTLPYRVNGLWYGCERITPGAGGGLNGVPYLPSTTFGSIFNNPNF
jgi:hypothetical protein